MTICRHSEETDDQLRARIQALTDHQARMGLRNILKKLGLRSARGIVFDPRTMYIRIPGRY